MNKSIPNLADISKPLRELLVKSVEWHWLEKQQEVYDISRFGCLFVTRESKGGLCIMSVNHQAEHKYPQIERKMLAIVYSTAKFHQNLYGKTVTVETDHKPLQCLFKKSLGKAPQHIQRMMLKVEQYDLMDGYICSWYHFIYC